MAVSDRLRNALKKAQILDNPRPGEVVFGNPATLPDIEEAEGVWEAMFPEDYRSFLLEYGGYELHTAHRVLFPGTSTWWFGDGIWTALGGGAESVKRDVVGLWTEDCESLRNELDLDPDWGAKLVPFAGRLPPYLYCFDFRFDPVAPPVVFYDVESGIHWNGRNRPGEEFTGLEYVADSFTHFVEQLRRDIEDLDALWGEARAYPKSPRQLEWETATQNEARQRLVPKQHPLG